MNTDIRQFSRVVFFTGAGVSAESGIPTYRGAGGIWAQYNYRDYACAEAFARDPLKVWDFHQLRRKTVASCEPNAGHRAIAAYQAKRPNTKVITQNIDGLHSRAGTKDLIELHGSLWRLRCDPCGVIAPNTDVPLDPIEHTCGAHWRPDIVWFGDTLSSANIQGALAAMESCDALISVGTSAVVYPAAEMPLVAKRAGATLIEINPEETPLSDAYDVHLRGKGGEILPALLAPILEG